MVDRLVNSEANTRRIATVESCFGSSGQPLAIPGRVLVGEGVLTKMCRKRPKSRQFFLFNDILVYGNIVIGKKKYNKQHIMPLEEVQLESIDDNGQYRNGWLIRTTTKSFVVYAATSTEKQEWMAHINKCVEDLLRKSGKKPVENHAAVWVPDNEASVCMHCKKTQFTMIVRRHHCRHCGAVVCGPCSSKKFLLPQQSTKAVRVCLGCYDHLSKAKAQEHHKAGVNAPDVVTAVGKSTNNNAVAAAVAAVATADSSAEDDSDGDEDEHQKHSQQQHCEPTFYGDSSVLSDKAEEGISQSLAATATTVAAGASTNNNSSNK